MGPLVAKVVNVLSRAVGYRCIVVPSVVNNLLELSKLQLSIATLVLGDDAVHYKSLQIASGQPAREG